MSQVIPEGWAEQALGNTVIVERGSSPRPIKNFQTNSADGVNWIKIGDTEEGQKYVTSTKEKITPDGALKSRFVDVGDFILSNSMSFGRPYIMKIAGYIHDGWFALRLPSSINTDYFYYLLSSSYIKNQFDLLAVGGVVKNISGELVKKATLPIPPLAEQKVIADKLDELLAQVESTKARLDAIPAILKSFRQSVLAAAVSGKLTEEWRGTEVRNWQHKTIGDLAEVATGTTPKRGEPRFWENPSIAWLTSAVTGNDYCVTADQFVTTTAVEECRLKLFKPGTLLLAMYGEGKTRGQVTELKIKATCNQACAAIAVNNDVVLTSFVKIRLQENYEETRKAAVGGNQPNLNLKKVREIPVELPSIKEQVQIVLRVEELFAFADKVEAQVNAAQLRVNNLTQSILAKAFRGELTTDWRTANPELICGENSAEALLKRIKAERESLAKATQTSKTKPIKNANSRKNT
jgi:type I restriction enzyme S subunit